MGAVVRFRHGGIAWRPWLPLALILAALTLPALSTKIYAGKTLVLSLGVKPWDQVFGVVKASGRAFWVVGYALLLGAIATVARWMPRGARTVVLATRWCCS